MGSWAMSWAWQHSSWARSLAITGSEVMTSCRCLTVSLSGFSSRIRAEGKLKSGATAGVVRVVMEREGETRRRDGQIKRIDVTDDRARMLLRGTIDFVFPDPRLYGLADPVSKAGVFPWVALDNTLGTAPSVPYVLAVPATAVSRLRLYQGSGAYLTYQPSSPIPAGARVEFLCDEGVVLQNGVFASGVSGSWPSVAPGASVDVGVDAGVSSVTMTVRFHPAWW